MLAGLTCVAAGAAFEGGWWASGSAAQQVPVVSALNTAPQVADAATRFASLSKYIPDPTSIRYAGRRDGLDRGSAFLPAARAQATVHRRGVARTTSRAPSSLRASHACVGRPSRPGLLV